MIMKSGSGAWSSFGPAPWIYNVVNRMKPFYYWLKDYNIRQYYYEVI